MFRNYPASLRNVSLLIFMVAASFTAQAQLDYTTSKEVTGFTSETDSTILFMDQGTGSLQNGQAEIYISEIIADQIDGERIEDMVTIFIQLEGNSNGVYITKKNKEAFIITELENGTSNANFSYEIMVKNMK